MKLCLLGLDGATWALLRPLMQSGIMPRLAELARQGVTADLLSTWPPVTALAWPTFYTGQNPGKHGVFSFVRQDRTGKTRVIHAADVQAPALWDWAHAAGLRVGVMGVPMTYPARPVDGFLITDFLTPPAAQHASHPPGLLAGLTAPGESWVFHTPPVEGEITLAATRAFAAALRHQGDQHLAALNRLLDTYQPDLLLSVWMHTDSIQHTFWGVLHPDHPRYHDPGAPALRQVLHPLFRQIDDMIAALAARVLPEGVLILLSDHGFGPVHRRLALNNALLAGGYLRRHEARYVLGGIQRRVQRKLSRWRQADPLVHVQRGLQQDVIDWRRTQAFSGAGHELCIYLNRTDRFAHGIVPPAAAPQLREEIAAYLLALRDDAGQPLLAAALPPDALYHGPNVAQAPDLILRPTHPGDIFTDGFRRDGRIAHAEAASGRGWHRREGIFLAVGAGIRPPPAAPLAPPTLLDLAPTALALLGWQPPAIMDGRILDEFLAHPLPPLRPLPDLANPWTQDKAAEGEEALLERLRGLGYI